VIDELPVDFIYNFEVNLVIFFANLQQSKLRTCFFIFTLCVPGNNSYLSFLHQSCISDVKKHNLWLSKGTVRSRSELHFKMHFYHLPSFTILEWKSWKELIAIPSRLLNQQQHYSIFLRSYIARDF
jgi:hypothetical protein